MVFDGVVFSGFCLRTCLAELGSKAFFVTVLFAAWCPWEGVRSHGGRHLQIGLVFAGAYIAFAVRVLTTEVAKDPECWSSVFDVASCISFLILGLKVRSELSVVDAREQRLLKKATKNAKDASLPGDSSADDLEKPKPQWNAAAFSGALPASSGASTPQYGGAITQYGAGFVPADGLLSTPPSDRLVSAVLAFLLPLLLVFMAQADDKSSSVLISAGKDLHRLDETSGALLGFLLATGFAAVVGLFMERTLSDHRLLFAASMLLFSLSLVSLSQALLYISAARPLPEHAGEAILALLGLGSMTGGALPRGA